MGLKSTLSRWFNSENYDNWTRTGALFMWFSGNSNKEVWVTIDGKEALLFKTTPELNIVINRFGQMLANGRYVHKRDNGTPEGEEIQDSPVVKLLESPNPMQTREEFIIESVIYYFIYGNTFTYPSGSRLTLPNTLTNLNPQYVKLELTGETLDVTTLDEVIKRVIYKDPKNNRERILMATDLFNLKRVDIDSKYIGTSILNSLQMPISNIRGSYGFRNVNITKRGAMGFISNDTKDMIGAQAVSEEDRLEISKQFTKEYGHLSGQSPIAIANGNLKWNHTAYPIGQMMLFEEVSENFKRIIDAVGLNDNIFSKEKSKVQANLFEGLKMAYQDAIIPFSSSYCSNLTKACNLPDNEWIEQDFKHLDIFKENESEKAKTDKEKAVTEKTKAEALKKLISTGAYSVEEAKTIIYG